MNSNKIVIHISGGVLIGVYADDSNVEVILYDEDNQCDLEQYEQVEQEKAFHGTIDNMEQVYQ